MKKIMNLILLPIITLFVLVGCSCSLGKPKDKVYISKSHLTTTFIETYYHGTSGTHKYSYTITAEFVNPTNNDIEVRAKFVAKQSFALLNGWSPNKEEVFIVPAKESVTKYIAMESSFAMRDSNGKSVSVTKKFSVTIVTQSPIENPAT